MARYVTDMLPVADKETGRRVSTVTHADQSEGFPADC